MAKVTINETPSEDGKKPEPGEFTVHDELGRAIVLQKPDVLAQYDLVDALGESAKNTTYLGMVTPILYVKTIDGDSFDFSPSKMGVRAAIKRLGEEGLTAVVDGMTKFFMRKSEEEFKASVKN